MSTHECNGCSEYQELSRRQFMVTTSAVALAAAAAPSWLPRVAVASSYRSSQRDTVISIFLRGASDGLTMCVPYQENAYYTNRPTLAIARPDSGQANRATDLDGFFGFPPAMLPLLPAYQDGKLLIVHACGSTDPSRSHFDAQRFMEVGKANDPTIGTGWLGRHLMTVDPMSPTAILRAVGISTGLQKQLVGGPQTLPIPNLDTFGLSGSAGTVVARTNAISNMYSVVPDPLHASALTTIATIDLLNTINFSGYIPANGAVYPTSGFGTAIKSVAALIKAQIGVEAVAIDLNGWDTHASQGVITGAMANLMNDLSTGLGAFYRDMNQPSTPTYTAVVMSEFGRRLLENGTPADAGTDHGHGNCMFVLGSCVDGGRVMRQWPGLAPNQLFEGRDLQVTIDYRDILAEIVSQRLGNQNLSAVFPSFTPTPRGVFDC